MAAPYIIRSFDARRDWAQFAAVNYETFRQSIPPGEPVDEEGFRRHHAWLLEHYEPANTARNTILVADFSGEYGGHCWISTQIDFFTREEEAWVFDLTVLPRFRRRGVATALMAAAEAMMKSRGMRYFGLQVMGHNPQAQKLYSRLGFGVSAFKLRKML